LIDRPLAKVTKQPKHGLEQFIMTLIHEMTGYGLHDAYLNI